MNSKALILAMAVLSITILLGGCSPADTAALEPGQSALLTPQQYQAQFGEDTTFSEHFLIDVRTAEEFASGHIAGAVNIPVDEIGTRLAEIPKDRTVVVYCRSGNRSATAARELASSDYAVYDLGGIITWTAAGYPVSQ
jgi:rhodanese-related sulfurtransferase